MIYADENVWMPVVEGLRRRGWEVRMALEGTRRGMLGCADGEHLDYAVENGGDLLTFDDDFLSFESSRYHGDHAGIIYVSQHAADGGELVRRIDDVLHQNAGPDTSGRVLYARTPVIDS